MAAAQGSQHQSESFRSRCQQQFLVGRDSSYRAQARFRSTPTSTALGATALCAKVQCTRCTWPGSSVVRVWVWVWGRLLMMRRAGRINLAKYGAYWQRVGRDTSCTARANCSEVSKLGGVSRGSAGPLRLEPLPRFWVCLPRGSGLPLSDLLSPSLGSPPRLMHAIQTPNLPRPTPFKQRRQSGCHKDKRHKRRKPRVTPRLSFTCKLDDRRALRWIECKHCTGSCSFADFVRFALHFLRKGCSFGDFPSSAN